MISYDEQQDSKEIFNTSPTQHKIVSELDSNRDFMFNKTNKEHRK